MSWVEKGKEFVRPHLWNARGWSSREKLLVIESDDWGADRNAHREGLEALRALGVRVDACHYMMYDGLALDEDLEGLFGVMEEFRDRDGNPPVMTANVLMANPDFERIREGGAKQGSFREYSSIGLEETFERKRRQRDGYRHGLSLWREGMDAGVFFPQLHGMEHVQVPRWMRLLQMGEARDETMRLGNAEENPALGNVFRTAFDAGIYGVSRSTLDGVLAKFGQFGISGKPDKSGQSGESRQSSQAPSTKPKSVQAALEVDSAEDKAVVMERISQAPAEFRRVFGYPSASFIAPNYTWFQEVEAMLVLEGVRYMQGATMQWIVSGGSGNGGFDTQLERRFMGQRYSSGLVASIRNVHFEPTEWWHTYQTKSDPVDRALRQIRAAFLWRRPAVISTHRVNYTGVMDPSLRERNLSKLRALLEHVLLEWPDVKFVTSEQLGDRMVGRQ